MTRDAAAGLGGVQIDHPTADATRPISMMSRRTPRFRIPPHLPALAAAALLALAACDVATSPVMRAALRVESDRAEYLLSQDQAPILSLHHQGGPDVTISGCPEAPSAILERRSGAGWAEEASRGLLCPATQVTETVVLEAGGSRDFAVVPWREGTYRVRVLIGPSALEPQRTVLSNEFDVR